MHDRFEQDIAAYMAAWNDVVSGPDEGLAVPEQESEDVTNTVRAMNRWETVEDRYRTGSMPGKRWAAYDADADRYEELPQIPLPDAVSAYNVVARRGTDTAIAAEEYGVDAPVAEEIYRTVRDDVEQDRDEFTRRLPQALAAGEEQQWHYDYLRSRIEGFLDTHYGYGGTITRSFYEQAGDLYVLDESTEEPERPAQITPVQSLQEALPLQELIALHDFIKDRGSIHWRGMWENADRISDVARQLYAVDDRDLARSLPDETVPLYDPYTRTVTLFNRMDDTFREPTPDQQDAITAWTDRQETYFERTFDLTDLGLQEE